MKISHRIRMLLLQRRANTLLHHVKQQRNHINRPHQQSVHMTSYPVPELELEQQFRLRTVYILAAVSMAGLAIYVNIYHEEPTPITACTHISVASR